MSEPPDHADTARGAKSAGVSVTAASADERHKCLQFLCHSASHGHSNAVAMLRQQECV